MRGTRRIMYHVFRKEPLTINFGVRPWASGGEPTEQRAGQKKIRLSEANQTT